MTLQLIVNTFMSKKLTDDRAFRTTLMAAAAVIILAGIMLAETFVTIMLLSIFISIIGVHPVSWLDKKKIPHWLSVTIVLLGFLLIISGLSGIIGGSISSFTSHTEKYEQRFDEIITSVENSIKPLGLDLTSERVTQILNPGKILNLTAYTLGQLGNAMSNATIIFFIVMFILLEMNDISKKAKALGGTTKSKKNFYNLSRIEKSIRHYLVIKTFTSLITGILVTFFLWIIGVEYAVLWGLIAFLLNYIPNIGSIIAAIPAILFSWIQLGFMPAIWVTIVYAAVNTFIGYMVEPRVMGKGMGLSTLVVFLSLIIWGYILGVVGMFLSVPLTMAIKIILENNESTRPLAAILGNIEEVEAFAKKQKPSNKKQVTSIN